MNITTAGYIYNKYESDLLWGRAIDDAIIYIEIFGNPALCLLNISTDVRAKNRERTCVKLLLGGRETMKKRRIIEELAVGQLWMVISVEKANRFC